MLEIAPAVAAQMRADRDVFQHGHVGHQLDVLEGAGDAELDDLLRRRVVDVACRARRSCRRSTVSTPVIRLKVVLLPAPLGPISATISRAWTSKETSLTAITPPNCLRALSICSSTLGGGRRRGCAPARSSDVSGRLRFGLERQPRHQPGPDAGRRQLQQHHQQDAEHDGLELAFAAETDTADSSAGSLSGSRRWPAPSTPPQT